MRSGYRSGIVSRAVVSAAVGLVATAALSGEASAQKPKKPAQETAATQPDEATRKAAREAYGRGTEAFKSGDYQAAMQGFLEANELIPGPHAQFWLAQSADKLGNRDEAIAAYQIFLGNPDANKLGERVGEARARLAALEEEAKAAEAAAAAAKAKPETKVEVTPEPPPAAEEEEDAEPADDFPGTPPEPDASGFMDKYKPKANTLEVGALGGALWLSRAHNLREDDLFRRAYLFPSWLFGVRAAYFPLDLVGGELEYAHGLGTVRTTEGSASFNTLRLQAVGQLPYWRIVPFAVLGAGFMHASSDDMGSDVDFMVGAGVGGKFAITNDILVRLDLRVDMMERAEDGPLSFSREGLLGVTYRLPL